MMRELPTSASFLLTEDCNLRCKYCFEKHNSSYMTKEVAQEAIDWLVGNTVKMDSDNFSVMLFGGEPFLNINICEFIFEYGYKKAQENNLKMNTSIITNATIMTDRLYSILKHYRDIININIQLSVDGTRDIQNEYRVTKNGYGSWNLVEKKIPKFKKLYDNNINDSRLSIHGCLNKKTLPHLYESYSFFRNTLKFKRIWFLCVMEEQWDINDVKIYKEQNELIYNDYIKEIRASMDINDSYCYAPFDKYVYLDTTSSVPCGAGRGFVTITANGDIYPCHQIYFNDTYKDTLIGNVFDKVLDEDRRRIFIEYEMEDLQCDDCKNSQCYKCIASNWVYKGGILNQIKGIYCMLSAVDNEFQRRLKKDVDDIFMVNYKSCSYTDYDCLCNCREAAGVNTCDIVRNQQFRSSGDNPDFPDCLEYSML